MPSDHLSPLDRAYAEHLAGATDDALRLALAVFAASPEELGAVTLIAEILVAREHGDAGVAALVRLVDAYTRRGDMGAATVAACLAVDAGENGEPLRTAIAKAFAKGSKRASKDAHPAPPPLPKKVEVDDGLRKLDEEALLDRAGEALKSWLETEDTVDASSKVPLLPLSSALAATTLARLLEAATVLDVEEGGAIIEQGTEGKAAFQVVRGMAEVVRALAEDEEVRLAALGPGAVFGEMALVSDATRAASVRALEPTRLLRFPRDTLEKLATRDANLGKELGRFCQARMVANLVRHSSILAAVAPSDRQALMDRFETRTFDAGERLVTRGEESGGLLIASGTVSVTSVDDDGDQIHITDLGPGDVVGEISLVLRRPATADVSAVHTTIALELGREQFQEAIKEHPSLLSELYELATSREDETNSVVAQEALDVEDIVLL